jgi:hypothetical protein
MRVRPAFAVKNARMARLFHPKQCDATQCRNVTRLMEISEKDFLPWGTKQHLPPSTGLWDAVAH